MDFTGTEQPMGLVMDVIGTEIKNAQAGRSSLIPTVVGDPGIGKSASLKYMAEQRNFGTYVISLGALPPEFMSGIPEFGEMKIDPKYILTYFGQNGEESSEQVTARTAEWTMPDLIRSINISTDSALAAGKDGLIVLLDDIHLVEPIVQKYLFEFFQNKTLQNYKLNEKAYLVAAMNGKDSAGFDGFLSAVINRMAFYYAKFDKDYWYSNIGYALHPYVASFSTGADIRYFSGANATDGPSASPRSWTDLSNAIEGFEEDNSDIRVFNSKLQMATEARVGQTAAIEFMKHVKLFQAFNFEKILNDNDTTFQIPNDISDQILMGYIVRYMKREQDVKFIKNLLERSLDKRTFIGVFMNEFITLLRRADSVQNDELKNSILMLQDILVSGDSIDSELMDIVVDAMSDIRG